MAGPQGAEGFKRGTPLDEATPERREQWLTELQKQGKYTEAEPLYQQALRIWEQQPVSIAAKNSPQVPLQKSPGVGNFALAQLSASLKFPRTSVL